MVLEETKAQVKCFIEVGVDNITLRAGIDDSDIQIIAVEAGIEIMQVDGANSRVGIT